jgi:hypothetical protein
MSIARMMRLILVVIAAVAVVVPAGTRLAAQPNGEPYAWLEPAPPQDQVVAGGAVWRLVDRIHRR